MRVTNECPAWINHALPINPALDEIQTKLSDQTVRQIHNANSEWEIHCVN